MLSVTSVPKGGRNIAVNRKLMTSGKSLKCSAPRENWWVDAMAIAAPRVERGQKKKHLDHKLSFGERNCWVVHWYAGYARSMRLKWYNC